MTETQTGMIPAPVEAYFQINHTREEPQRYYYRLTWPHESEVKNGYLIVSKKFGSHAEAVADMLEMSKRLGLMLKAKERL